jgi:hypothetical protein
VRRRRSDLGFYFVSTFLPPFVLLIRLTVAAYFAFKIVPGGLAGRGRSPGRSGCAGLLRSWWLTLASTGAIVGPTRSPALAVSASVHHDPKHVYFLISAPPIL